MTRPLPWLFAIISLGILSRTVHTGWVLFDKYLGDALYAVVVYMLLRLRWNSVTIPALAIMTAIELFQLTRIPANLLLSDHLLVQLFARLLGTEFSLLDLLAYAVGIACVYLADSPPQ